MVPQPTSSTVDRSRLNRTQRCLLQLLVGLAVFMLADTLYLLANRAANALGIAYFAVTETSLPKFYQGMVLSHTGVGVVLVILALAFVEWHLPAQWRSYRKQALYTGGMTAVLGGVLLVTGLFILSEANSRENAWAWWLHIAAAAALPVFYIAHRRISIWKPSAVSYRRIPAMVAALAVLAVALHGVTYVEEGYTDVAEQAFAAGTHTGPGSKLRDLSADSTFVPANFVPFKSPFFPAATTTTTGSFLPARIITRGGLPEQEMLDDDIDRNGFASEEKVGSASCERCHRDIVEQWATSAHRFASFNNPFYEASVMDLRLNSPQSNAEVDDHIDYFSKRVSATGDEGGALLGREGMVKSKWCSGCHDPALMLAGQMSSPIDRKTPQAQAGLTCLSCHAIDHIHNNTGNGNYNIADHQEDPYLFPESSMAVGRLIHDTALKARPAVHKRQMMKPFFKSSEFCATCHKVSLDSRLNNYRWLRGQDEYDNWHDSGVALNASRTFYLPGYERVCQDCHMPLEEAVRDDVSAKGGYVKSHRFLAVNTALPYLRGDQETIDRIEAFLQDEKLRVDVFAVRSAADQGSARYLAEGVIAPALTAGERVQFDVVVRNHGVGHTFPGGTNDSNEGWLEVTARDGQGRIVAFSGGIGEDGHVDPDAHFYKALLVDRYGEPIHRRNAQDIYAPVYVRAIGPGTADVAHYSLVIPEDSDGTLHVHARLLWRKFDRAYTEFAYHANPEGFAAWPQVPDLPVTEISSAQVTLAVDTKATQAAMARISTTGERSATVTAPEWVRHNDYGIGLLLQGDTRNAQQAFAAVEQLVPERVDGVRNQVRVALQDGDLDRAYELLNRCEKIAPGDAQTAWFWGVVHQTSGRYVDAVLAYRHLLNSFPDDRAAWRNLGRTFYLNGQFEEALKALDEVLRIDPEDRSAHYHRMLSLRSLGRDGEANTAKVAYEYYQIDESAQRVTRGYRMRDSQANREAQPIHIHDLSPDLPDRAEGDA
ncbi:MAG: tetratricopeptide repeat protein [Candidatus Latescibacterota bacterium]|nr:tetratricopeptide repeat protein [Candidatus Latescibacterota bacterium]